MHCNGQSFGGIKRGWSEIKSSYEKLFASRGICAFEFYDYTLHQASDLFYAVGRERGEPDIGGHPMRPTIRTTRVFRRDALEEWRQVHHHGSIDDPQMLRGCQNAILGTP
jgi:ketosteroid isomerase-like protein